MEDYYMHLHLDKKYLLILEKIIKKCNKMEVL